MEDVLIKEYERSSVDQTNSSLRRAQSSTFCIRNDALVSRLVCFHVSLPPSSALSHAPPLDSPSLLPIGSPHCSPLPPPFPLNVSLGLLTASEWTSIDLLMISRRNRRRQRFRRDRRERQPQQGVLRLEEEVVEVLLPIRRGAGERFRILLIR